MSKYGTALGHWINLLVFLVLKLSTLEAHEDSSILLSLLLLFNLVDFVKSLGQNSKDHVE